MIFQAIRDRLEALRDSAAKLDAAILDQKAKEHFLRAALDSLKDAEYAFSQAQKAPTHSEASMWSGRVELQLRIAEKHLKNLQDAVSKNGLNVNAIG